MRGTPPFEALEMRLDDQRALSPPPPPSIPPHGGWGLSPADLRRAAGSLTKPLPRKQVAVRRDCGHLLVPENTDYHTRHAKCAPNEVRDRANGWVDMIMTRGESSKKRLINVIRAEAAPCRPHRQRPPLPGEDEFPGDDGMTETMKRTWAGPRGPSTGEDRRI